MSQSRCSRNAVRLGVMVVLSNRGQDVRVCGSGGVPWRRAGQPVASQCATRARLSTWREARAGRGGRGGRGGPRRRRRAPTRPPNTDCLVCASSETTLSYHYRTTRGFSSRFLYLFYGSPLRFFFYCLLIMVFLLSFITNL